MMLPTVRSIFRGKQVKEEGILIERSFEQVQIDRRMLEAYAQFMNFESSSPMSYLYILAQRAQLAVMLEPSFTIAIPGMIHLSNDLEQLNEVNFDTPFDLKVDIQVPYKSEGALIPKLEVNFWQVDQLVARCVSTYYVKRKKKRAKKPPKKEETPMIQADYSEDWDLHSLLGKQYAKVSGDSNPIHTSKLFARLMGFKSSFIHGWYSVSRIVRTVEQITNRSFQKIEVAFKSPVYLPSEQTLVFEKEADDSIFFQLKESTTDKLTLEGVLKSSHF